MKFQIAIALGLLVSFSQAAEPPNFRDHVLPLFKKHCNNCHNPDKKKADLDLTSVAGIQKGSSGGEVVRVGTPDSSPLFMAMNHDEDFDPMPPKKPKLDEKTLAVVREWIAGGMIPHAGGESGLREVSYDVTAGSAARPEEVAIPTSLPKVTNQPGPVLALAASPWADVFAVAGHREVRMYAPTKTNEIELIGAMPFELGAIHQLRFSPNGSLLAAAGGKGAHSGAVNLYDVKSGKLQATVGDEQDIVLAADISSDHNLVALGGPSRVVKIHQTKDSKLLHRIEKHTDWVTAVRFSPDGKLLATGDRNGAVHVWESANGGIVYTLSEHKAGITDLAWRPDGGVLATTGEDGKLVLWSMDDGFPLRALKAHKKKSSDRYTRLTGALDVAYLPNGGLFTSGRDRALRLWTTDGAKLKSLPEIPDLPLAATVTHDGSKALTGHRDGRVLLWDLKSGSSTELPR